MEDDDSTPSSPSRSSHDGDWDRPLLSEEATINDSNGARDHRQQGRRGSFLDGDGGLASVRAKREHSGRSRLDLKKELTVREAIKAYPMAVFWSLAVSMCVIMEGFDSILVPNFYAFPTFQRKYGEFVGVTDQSATWMAVIGTASGIGAVLGTILNGHLVDHFGQKRVLIGALVMLSCLIFMTFFAPNIQVLAIGQFLCGFPWGIFATVAPAYSSEVLPLSLRSYLSSFVNMAFIIGQIICSIVIRVFLERDDEWSFRLPFAFQWIWPSFLIPLLCFAPESPWHLVRKGRLGEAERSLRRLQSSKAQGVDVKSTLADIVHTNNLEQELEVGTSYWDCFRGFELRRTEIACLVFAGQNFSGLSFAYNATYFYEQVGLSAETTYNLSLFGTSLAFLATLANWFLLMPYYGRRTIYTVSMLVMASILFLIGILTIWTDHFVIAMSQALLTIVWTITFQLSVGQLGWSIPAEVGSTRLRTKSICLARNAYYLVGFIGGAVQPYMLNPESLNWRGYTGFFWFTTAIMTFVWAYYRLPETRGRTYEELDLLFARGVDARKFETTDVRGLHRHEMQTVPRKNRHGSQSIGGDSPTWDIVDEDGQFSDSDEAGRSIGSPSALHTNNRG